MRRSLCAQVAATEVDAHNYNKVAETLSKGLKPWSGQSAVSAPTVGREKCKLPGLNEGRQWQGHTS